MRWARLWRRAAGVADYVGEGAPGRHFGRWLCLNCPRDWHEPPFLPFALQIHVREHRERFPDHAIAWWCWDHLIVEEVHTTGWRWFYDSLYVDNTPISPHFIGRGDGRRSSPPDAGRPSTEAREERVNA